MGNVPFGGGNSVGTTADMVSRLRVTLPEGWFPTPPPFPVSTITPVLDGLLTGLAAAWSFCFGLLSITSAQARLTTASGFFLDMISIDFFGPHLPRIAGELDEEFRIRIKTNLISRRGTRQDVYRAVVEATSSVPALCEPVRGLDCGGYGSLGNPDAGGGLGYGTPALHYGSGALAFQYFLNIGERAAYAPDKISRRQSPATFINSAGFIEIVSGQVLRPNFQQGVCIGAFLESRAFNLIVNSRSWTDFAQSTAAGSGSVSWFVDHLTPGIFDGDPVLNIVGNSATRISGPSVDVAVAGLTTCGSAWIYLTAGSTIGNIELILTDLNHGNSVFAAADMTRVGRWQRLNQTLQTQAAAGKNLRMGLLLSGSSHLDASVLTQCWQVELGDVPTSYIPTAGVLGIREQDDYFSLDPTVAIKNFTVADVLDAVASAIPAATVAWTAISPVPLV